jgi:hypothetical protein
MLIDSESGYTQIFVLVMMGSALLVCVRVLWFVFLSASGTGWWGSFVLLFLIVGHFVIPLSNLAVISSHVSAFTMLNVLLTVGAGIIGYKNAVDGG